MFIIALMLLCISVWNFLSYLQDIRKRKALFMVNVRGNRKHPFSGF
ncbi:small membrane protein [Pluralibacter gergoviae]|uniref:Small membrane protein n=1 Tax=Pluralibacter gergoviae TaxID=61647 RepID=A0AAI9DR53_PLUGE|nr:small membrane protein [Pluralibacter gergoviae]EKV0918303.1 small membrane protein [Pluralibacter gergoviae]EKV0929720.1 small membrane protein [Pluralibacter gergoviae]EKV3544236.1 small membrane protein [Pluralibacter gergoviae]EKV6247708.1 small membrane protein [Pluralibacter gergoviae]